MAKADTGPAQAASGRLSGVDEDPKDTADLEGQEAVDTVNDTESTVNKPASLLDKEARMRAEQAEQQAEGPRATVWGAVDERGNVLSPYAVEGNDTSAYVGVNPEYATYGTEQDRPYQAGEGSAERYFEDQLLSPKKFAVAAPFNSKQTEGGGSSVPLLYPDVSGEAYVNEPVKVTEAPDGLEVTNPDLKGATPEALGDPSPSGRSATRTADGAVPSEKAEPSEF